MITHKIITNDGYVVCECESLKEAAQCKAELIAIDKADGTYEKTIFDGNGNVVSKEWTESNGSYHTEKLNADGTALVEYTYTAATGGYEFNGFIPGDYIVRFIYGDGTTYDMTGNVIKYNGQDYKSMPDSNYNKEWYNSSSYTAGASVARDNEARRLETMGYAVEVNTVKGILARTPIMKRRVVLNSFLISSVRLTGNHFFSLPVMTGWIWWESMKRTLGQ